ncbi:MAG TPA: AAA family ATPase, partial [archaeon]|nr:AAA family ATPase [archaeon]
IDEALRRPGRFDREIEIGVPSKKDRFEILQIHSRGMPLTKFNKKEKEVLNFLASFQDSSDASKIFSEVIQKPQASKDDFLSKLFEHCKKNVSKDVSHADLKDIISKFNVDLGLKMIKDRPSLKISSLLAELAGKRLSEEIVLEEFANITHGFVGADLEALAKESAMKALRRYLPKINLDEETIPPDVLESLEVNKDDFADALKDVQPSALREVAIEIPNIKWSDIGGLEKVKDELKQAVEWPLKKPEAFVKMGIKPPRGVLFYGPPGTGKTLLAKAVAAESEANFISIKGPQLISMWVGESEKGIRKIFQRARQVSPVIIFFDEIDAIAPRRGAVTDSGVSERMVNQLLTELDGVEELKGVVFIAATNRPDLIDPALLRPGRIDKIIQIPAPDLESRKHILRIHTKGVPLAKNVSIDWLEEVTEGYSGADLEGLVRESALIALQESKMKPTEIKLSNFEEAMGKIVPSISKETVDAYNGFKSSVAQAFKPSYVR